MLRVIDNECVMSCVLGDELMVSELASHFSTLFLSFVREKLAIGVIQSTNKKKKLKMFKSSAFSRISFMDLLIYQAFQFLIAQVLH